MCAKKKNNCHLLGLVLFMFLPVSNSQEHDRMVPLKSSGVQGVNMMKKNNENSRTFATKLPGLAHAVNPTKPSSPTISLRNNEAQVITLHESEVLEVLPEVTSNGSFMIVQIHSQIHNVTLSESWPAIPDHSTKGRDVAMLSVLAQRIPKVIWYVSSHSEQDIQILVKLNIYGYNVPLPGACSLDFPLENDPNIHMTSNHFVTLSLFEYGDVGIVPNGGLVNYCEDSKMQNLLEYDVYVHFLDEGDLSKDHFMAQMKEALSGISWENVTPSGKKAATITYKKERSNVTVATFPGVGMLVTVVIRQKNNSRVTSAAYVSMVTYGCDLRNDHKYCLFADGIALKVVCTVAGVVGLLLCLFGHQYFKTEMYLIGFLTFMLISYIVLTRLVSWDYTVILIVSATIGTLGGALWLLFWWFVGVPVMSVLLAGLVLGYLLTSILFNLTPLGNLPVWSSAFNYGMAFACGVLIFPVILLTFTKTLNIVTCAVIGSYGVVIAVNSYLHTSLFHILLISLYKATIPDYQKAVIIVPFQLYDMLLCGGWGVLAVIGVITQFSMSKGKPDFPPCPHQHRKHQNIGENQSEIRSIAGERAPLLDGEGGRRYTEPPPPYTESADENIRTEWGSS